MLYVGSFYLTGEAHGFSKHFNVYRKDQVLVIEFINNAMLPILVRDEGDGLCSLWIRNHKLFDTCISVDSVLNIRMRGGLTATDVDIELSVGGGVRALQTNIGVHVSGQVNLEPYPMVQIPSKDMELWMKCYGIKRVEGISTWIGESSRTPGHSLSIKSDAFIVTFPNGFCFPIMRVNYGVSVAGSEIKLGAVSPSGLFLRTKEYDSDHVLFRANFVANGSITVVDNILYTKDYAEYDGKRVKSADITKWLLLNKG